MNTSTRLALAASLCLVCTAGSLAQWSSDPAVNLPIAIGPGGQELPKVAATAGGATWISWFDNATGNYNVYLQHLNPAGVKTFPGSGLLVSSHPALSSLVDYDLIVDSGGNAVIVFTDARAGTDRDVYAYRISPAGEFLWGPDGVTLSANNAFEADPRVVQASNGEFVFLWPRLDPPSGLVMQRLDSDGNKLLGEDGLLVVGGGSEKPAFCEMVASNNGAVIAVWVRDTTSFASPRHLHAQKFDTEGEPMWGFGPTVVVNSSVPIAHRPRIAADGAGAVIAWHDSRLANQFNVWVQRLSQFGEPLWAVNGVQASTNNVDRGHFDPAIVVTPGVAGWTYVFWNERNSAQSQWGITGQRITPTGSRLWGDTGVTLLPINGINKSSPRAVFVGGSGGVGGEAMVFCLDQPATPLPGNRVLAMRIAHDGTMVWGGDAGGGPVIASSNPSAKARLPVAVGPPGVAKLVWEDTRDGTNDIYAQGVNPDGTLGGGPTCPADWNGDGVVNSQDISTFITDWLISLSSGILLADFNGDGVTNSTDISAFISAWLDAVINGC